MVPSILRSYHMQRVLKSKVSPAIARFDVGNATCPVLEVSNP